MAMKDLRDDIAYEVATILAGDFNIAVTDTNTVPHFADPAITFPNLDQKYQRTKLLETAVLYVDMRRSTELNFLHRRQTVARLYSAFVRAMTRCANHFSGEVRGIIGDRVMVLFDQTNCFANAYNTAILMNSVCKHVINKRFTHNEVEFGIGIDYGRMLATKTGIVRRGGQQQNYQARVWLGRPANVASKLTDHANKPEESFDITKVNVCYDYGAGPTWVKEWPWDFIKQFTHNALTGNMHHWNNAFRKFEATSEKYVMRPKTKPVLMTEAVYKGLKQAAPTLDSIVNGWIQPITGLQIKEYPGTVYGTDVIYTAFREGN